MNQILLLGFKVFLFQLSLQMNTDNMCSHEKERFEEFSRYNVISLGEGGYGKVFGNGQIAVKLMKLRKKDVELTQLELNNLIAFEKTLDILHVKEQGCYCEVK